jgi:putative (di)nucleoside polyphosphate hydrolase
MSNDWIDEEGYRANVGIILADDAGKLLLGGRVSNKGWQFPQGGVSRGEDLRAAMYRELREEIGLEKDDVEVLGVTQDWIRYRLPDKYVRRNSTPVCIGQKQRWFMLRLIGPDDKLRFDLGEQAEFDRVRWVDYWRPVNEVIYFKLRVYAQALHELGLTAYPHELPPRPRWWPKRWQTAFEKDIAPPRMA